MVSSRGPGSENDRPGCIPVFAEPVNCFLRALCALVLFPHLDRRHMLPISLPAIVAGSRYSIVDLAAQVECHIFPGIGAKLTSVDKGGTPDPAIVDIVTLSTSAMNLAPTIHPAAHETYLYNEDSSRLSSSPC